MRYLCVHCHFYQPPREDPWIDKTGPDAEAAPYRDWNERIAAECYTPNTAARILDSERRILKIVNNYARISFDFGPTLLNWLERSAKPTYEAIRQADRDSAASFSGHGSAMAHAYNHMILPLANRRDKVTQVRWGIQDFVHRFGRQPEGMWLPETAVDLESLEIMAAEGIRFTLLSPRQAMAVRAPDAAWQDINGGQIDPRRPYLCRLPSGASMAVFFYDGQVSQAVSFEGLLDNGEKLAERLLSAYSADPAEPELVHVVTDGETYGHHQRYGEMALAFALDWIEAQGEARITNYGEFLAAHPPVHEVRIIENTSWSCAHGVERWRQDCGCNSGRTGWSQQWRAPLREALNWLRDRVAAPYESRAADLVHDPWAARDGYIQVVLDRSAASRARFERIHRRRLLEARDRQELWRLLELQRHAMLMYTSCGWFFDELSGIETVQVIRHAARVVELAEILFGASPEPEFLRRLALAASNLREQGDGASIYERMAKPLRLAREIDLPVEKESYNGCSGLGLLHEAIRSHQTWPRPMLNSGDPIQGRVGESRRQCAESEYARHGEERGSLLGFLRDQGIAWPKSSLAIAERGLNSLMQRALSQADLDGKRIASLLAEARAVGVSLDGTVRECAGQRIERLSRRCRDEPGNPEFLAELNGYLAKIEAVGLRAPVWEAQNVCYSLLRSGYSRFECQAEAGDALSQSWIEQARLLAGRLALRIPEHSGLEKW